jgi:hypothetical protein
MPPDSNRIRALAGGNRLPRTEQELGSGPSHTLPSRNTAVRGRTARDRGRKLELCREELLVAAFSHRCSAGARMDCRQNRRIPTAALNLPIAPSSGLRVQARSRRPYMPDSRNRKSKLENGKRPKLHLPSQRRLQPIEGGPSPGQTGLSQRLFHSKSAILVRQSAPMPRSPMAQ